MQNADFLIIGAGVAGASLAYHLAASGKVIIVEWYFKPDAGQILASPADETPVPPQDIQPDELDIATLVDRLQGATTLEIKRINRSWAGLRSFVDDHCPVVGFAPDTEGFFWLVGQGGYGIQTSYALGKTAASLLIGGPVPEEIAAFDVTKADLGPARLWGVTATP